MKTKHILSSVLLGAPVAAMLLFSSGAGCILDEDFLKVQDQSPCEMDSDCSEPGFTCRNGFCAIDDGSAPPCEDQDEDGYGVGTDRRDCEFPELDADDNCAECNPGAKELCDGLDNDTNGSTDESISCENITDCPSAQGLPTNTRWSCSSNQCVVIPSIATGECDIVISCVGGSYDTAEAMSKSCL